MTVPRTTKRMFFKRSPGRISPVSAELAAQRMEGKVALVTGAASGIGAATTRRLAAEGASVVLADINLEGAQSLAGELGDAALAVECDVEDPAAISAAVSAAVAAFGRLDVLHNNAALITPEVLAADTNAVDIPLEMWDRIMAVNLRGYLAGCKYAIPVMAERGGGSIICTTSGAGFGGDVLRIAYGCSKGAIMTLVRYVATQHGEQGIRCNAVAPGLVKTPALLEYAPQYLDLLRPHMLTDHVVAEDVAALVAFLASDEARHLTGQVIPIDAGFSAHLASAADLKAALAAVA